MNVLDEARAIVRGVSLRSVSVGYGDSVECEIVWENNGGSPGVFDIVVDCNTPSGTTFYRMLFRDMPADPGVPITTVSDPVNFATELGGEYNSVSGQVDVVIIIGVISGIADGVISWSKIYQDYSFPDSLNIEALQPHGAMDEMLWHTSSNPTIVGQYPSGPVVDIYADDVLNLEFNVVNDGNGAGDFTIIGGLVGAGGAPIGGSAWWDLPPQHLEPLARTMFTKSIDFSTMSPSVKAEILSLGGIVNFGVILSSADGASQYFNALADVGHLMTIANGQVTSATWRTVVV